MQPQGIFVPRRAGVRVFTARRGDIPFGDGIKYEVPGQWGGPFVLAGRTVAPIEWQQRRDLPPGEAPGYIAALRMEILDDRDLRRDLDRNSADAVTMNLTMGLDWAAEGASTPLGLIAYRCEVIEVKRLLDEHLVELTVRTLDSGNHRRRRIDAVS